jgi:hypothetical protein
MRGAMGAEDKRDSIYNVMGLIYKVLKQQDLVTDLFLERVVHADASAKSKQYLAELSSEDKIIWYMIMIMYKIVFEEAGNYYKYKESDPEKFTFLNNKRPFYQSVNRVDLTKAYIFEQAFEEIKNMNFQDLESKTGVKLDPKTLGNKVRNDVVRRTKEI